MFAYKVFCEELFRNIYGVQIFHTGTTMNSIVFWGGMENVCITRKLHEYKITKNKKEKRMCRD
jgi:hypothetical protein